MQESTSNKVLRCIVGFEHIYDTSKKIHPQNVSFSLGNSSKRADLLRPSSAGLTKVAKRSESLGFSLVGAQLRSV